jgi:hypothetical protein
LYGCETRSLDKWEGYRLRAFEDAVREKFQGPERGCKRMAENYTARVTVCSQYYIILKILIKEGHVAAYKIPCRKA